MKPERYLSPSACASAEPEGQQVAWEGDLLAASIFQLFKRSMAVHQTAGATVRMDARRLAPRDAECRLEGVH
jgi:hypothetical protein